jgi:hypothetical protein
MEPFENEKLTDRELDGMLREWRSAPVPAGLRAAVFPQGTQRWWRRSIRIPIPLAACAVIVLAAGAWRAAVPKRIEVPVVVEHVETRVVYQNRAPGGESLTFGNLRPVAELRPRIIRSGHAEN